MPLRSQTAAPARATCFLPLIRFSLDVSFSVGLWARSICDTRTVRGQNLIMLAQFCPSRHRQPTELQSDRATDKGRSLNWQPGSPDHPANAALAQWSTSSPFERAAAASERGTQKGSRGTEKGRRPQFYTRQRGTRSLSSSPLVRACFALSIFAISPISLSPTLLRCPCPCSPCGPSPCPQASPAAIPGQLSARGTTHQSGPERRMYRGAAEPHNQPTTRARMPEREISFPLLSRQPVRSAGELQPDRLKRLNA